MQVSCCVSFLVLGYKLVYGVTIGHFSTYQEIKIWKKVEKMKGSVCYSVVSSLKAQFLQCQIAQNFSDTPLS